LLFWSGLVWLIPAGRMAAPPATHACFAVTDTVLLPNPVVRQTLFGPAQEKIDASQSGILRRMGQEDFTDLQGYRNL
jgi:hypothetical protein